MMTLNNLLFRQVFKKVCPFVVSLTLITSAANSGDIIFQPINPSFGGSSFNSAHLIGLANAQNIPKRKAEEKKRAAAETAREARKSTDSDRFVRLLESRLYSGLASEVSQAIFGENAQQQGRVRFQDQEITWVNDGTEIKLIVNDFGNGETTEIVIPTVTR